MFNLPSRLIVLVFTAVIFISSCQNKKPQPRINDWDKLKIWSFKGKLAINDGKNSGSGRIKWTVAANKTQAVFKAPLGQGSWEIIETDEKAKLISSKNGTQTANTAQQLISSELGWEFPWNSLKSWLRGHQADKTIKVINQSMPSFSEDGWKITYTKWTKTTLGLLPKKIKATKPPYSVKLIIYDWDFE